MAACATSGAPRSVPGGAPAGPLAILERSERETRTLTAMFRMTVRKPGGGSETSRAALAVARPDRLRLQVFSLGFVTVWDYTVAGERFRLRRPLERFEETGRLDDAGEAAPAWDLRPLFLRPVDPEGVAAEDAGEAWTVSAGPQAARRVLTIGKQSGVVEAETLHRGGRPWLEARYLDHRPVESFPLPFRIEIAYPASGVAVTIEVSSYSRNRPVDEAIFEL